MKKNHNDELNFDFDEPFYPSSEGGDGSFSAKPKEIRMTRRERKQKKLEEKYQAKYNEVFDDNASGITPWHERRQYSAPHALTADELLNHAGSAQRQDERSDNQESFDGSERIHSAVPEEIPMSGVSDEEDAMSDAAQMVFKRMQKRIRQQSSVRMRFNEIAASEQNTQQIPKIVRDAMRTGEDDNRSGLKFNDGSIGDDSFSGRRGFDNPVVKEFHFNDGSDTETSSDESWNIKPDETVNNDYTAEAAEPQAEPQIAVQPKPAADFAVSDDAESLTSDTADSAGAEIPRPVVSVSENRIEFDRSSFADIFDEVEKEVRAEHELQIERAISGEALAGLDSIDDTRIEEEQKAESDIGGVSESETAGETDSASEFSAEVGVKSEAESDMIPDNGAKASVKTAPQRKIQIERDEDGMQTIPLRRVHVVPVKISRGSASNSVAAATSRFCEDGGTHYPKMQRYVSGLDDCNAADYFKMYSDDSIRQDGNDIPPVDDSQLSFFSDFDVADSSDAVEKPVGADIGEEIFREPDRTEDTRPSFDDTPARPDGETRMFTVPVSAADDGFADSDTSAAEVHSDSGTQMWDAQFAAARAEKADKFKLFGDREEDVPPDQMPPSFDDEPIEEIEDYDSVDDGQSILLDFVSRARGLKLRVFSTAAVTALLIWLASPASFLPFGGALYFSVIALLLVLAAVININTIRSVAELIHLGVDADTAPSLAVLAATVQAVVMAASGAADGAAATGVFAAAAALSLTFNAVGKLMMVNRVISNLDMITNEDYKNTAVLIEPPESAKLADSSVLGETLICGRRKAIDLGGYLKHSLSLDTYEELCPRILAISAAVSVIAGVIAAVTLGGAWFMTAMCTVLCVAAPVCGSMIGSMPFSFAGGKLRGDGTMLSGYSAASELSDCNAVELDAAELFGGDSVSLYKIRPFENGQPLDRAIVSAAALAMYSKSPLAGMFYKMIQGEVSKMPEIDSVIYEERMGLTGWVGGRKTIMGNRMIMEAHNVSVPSIDFDRKVLQKGYFPVYLASEGVLDAMFIVGYSADEETACELRRLVSTGVTLLIKTCDPNVSEDMIAEYFGVYRESVMVMSSDAARLYDEMTLPQDKGEAMMASKNGIGFMRGFMAAIRIRSCVQTSTVAAVILMFAAMALCLYFTITGQTGMLNIYSVFAYQLVQLLTQIVINIIKKA